MTIIKSRVKKGTLSFTPGTGEAIDFSCQPTSVVIATEYEEEGEALEVLCGDAEAATVSPSRSLNITALQDFDNKSGLQAFLFTNEGTSVAFEWKPNSDGGPTYSGNCQCRVGDIGGEVAAQLTSDLELPIAGDVAITYPTGEVLNSATSADLRDAKAAEGKTADGKAKG